MLGADYRPFVFASHKSGWWFSTQGEDGTVTSAVFIVDGHPPRQARVVLPRESPLVSLPIRGDEPRQLAISVQNEQPALRIDEITPGGVTQVGAYEWWETGFRRTVLGSRWSGEALGDGRFAIVAVDGPPAQMTLKLRIVGGGDAVETDLPCGVAIDHPLATTTDSSGRLAVVGVAADGRVVAHLVDVRHPEAARCRVISGPDEIAARPPYGTPSIVWTGEAFVTAWIRDDGAVRACELHDLNVSPYIVDVGEGAAVDLPIHQLLYAEEEYVTFVWRERSGRVVLRRLPREVTGTAVAIDLWRRLCATFARFCDGETRNPRSGATAADQ